METDLPAKPSQVEATTVKICQSQQMEKRRNTKKKTELFEWENSFSS
jgi:hypothetical protein